MILLPLYLQNIRGLTELQTGLLVMPGGLAMGLLGPQVGKIYDRFGSRPLVIPGSIGMVVALGVLSRVGLDTPYWLILAAHVVLMACLAAIFTPVFTLGLGDLPHAVVLPRQLAAGHAPAGRRRDRHRGAGRRHEEPSARTWSPTASSLPEAFVGGLQWAFVVGAVIGVVVVVLALLLPAAEVEVPEGAPAAH